MKHVNLALNEDSFVATNRQDWWCIRSHSVSSRKVRPKHQPGTRNRRNLRRSIHRRPLLPSCCVGPNPRLLPKTRRWRNRSDTSRLTSPNHNRGKGQTEITGKSCGYCFTFIVQSKLFLLGLQVFPFKKMKETYVMEQTWIADDSQIKFLSSNWRRARNLPPHLVKNVLNFSIGHALSDETLGLGSVTKQFANHTPAAPHGDVQLGSDQHGKGDKGD